MTDPTNNEADDSLPDESPSATLPQEDQVTAARKEAAASHERYLRAVADLENFRKRTVREKDELRQAATSGVLEDVIPIVDNLALGLAAAKKQSNVKQVVDGISLVLEQFKTTLSRHGLKEINPVGAAFDPHLHECISHEASEEVESENVIKVVRLGYMLNNRLLRPASVVVSSGPAHPVKAKA